MSCHRLRVLFFAIMFLTAGVPHVAAQDYPTRTVTIIVPFTPAGATDILGRMAAAALEARLGKSFVVENRPGAGQQIGVNAVARDRMATRYWSLPARRWQSIQRFTKKSATTR